MKMIQLKFRTLLFLIILGFTFVSCSNSNDETPEELGATATITLSDGEVLEFKSTFYTSVSTFDHMYGVGFTNANSGMKIYMMFIADETLVPGTHNGYITVSQIGSNSDIIDESYDSHNNEGAGTHDVGSSILTITNMENDRMQGTFSGILYSASGKKLTIESGVFNIDSEGFVIN